MNDSQYNNELSLVTSVRKWPKAKNKMATKRGKKTKIMEHFIQLGRMSLSLAEKTRCGSHVLHF